jgi:hypothetical protein
MPPTVLVSFLAPIISRTNSVVSASPARQAPSKTSSIAEGPPLLLAGHRSLGTALKKQIPSNFRL